MNLARGCGGGGGGVCVWGGGQENPSFQLVSIPPSHNRSKMSGGRTCSAYFYIGRLLLLLPVLPVLLLIRYNRKLRFLDNLECLISSLLMPSSEFSTESNRQWIRLIQSKLEPNWAEDFGPWVEASFPTLAHSIDTYSTEDGTVMRMLKTLPPRVAHDAVAPIMILYFHSGGMVGGCPLDPVFKSLVEHYGSSCVVVGAEFRRAIDGHHWPVGVEDCYACVAYLSQQTNALIVTGHSSGAYLALACGLRARTDRLMKIHHLIAYHAHRPRRQPCDIFERS